MRGSTPDEGERGTGMCGCPMKESRGQAPVLVPAALQTIGLQSNQCRENTAPPHHAV